MEHTKQVEILKALMQQLDEGKNIDAGVQYRHQTKAYVCTDRAAKGRETIFQNHPQLIGLSGDLPEKGSYLALDDFGVPILATRDKDGQFSLPKRVPASRSTSCERTKGSRERIHVSISPMELRANRRTHQHPQ